MARVFTVGSVIACVEADMVIFIDRRGTELDIMDVEDNMRVLEIRELPNAAVEVKVDVDADDLKKKG